MLWVLWRNTGEAYVQQWKAIDVFNMIDGKRIIKNTENMSVKWDLWVRHPKTQLNKQFWLLTQNKHDF